MLPAPFLVDHFASRPGGRTAVPLVFQQFLAGVGDTAAVPVRPPCPVHDLADALTTPGDTGVERESQIWCGASNVHLLDPATLESRSQT
ncbi:hypothetical protein BCD49_33335 [Pseudofrankia sp. EUN1h]|nr:hypothetical protein BCD49_33335 [Pseudofrankia sp. EUN1h]